LAVILFEQRVRKKKRLFTGKGRRPVKFLHDNAWPHMAKLTKGTLLELG